MMGPPGPAPGMPARRKSNRRLIIWLSVGGGGGLLVLIALAVVVGILLSDSTVGQRLRPVTAAGAPDLGIRWSKSTRPMPEPEEWEHGMWLAGDQVVRYLHGKVTAFSARTGQPSWSRGDICGAAAFDEDEGYLWTRAEGDCRVLSKVDPASGKVTARTDLLSVLGEPGGSETTSPQLARVGAAVVIGGRDRPSRDVLVALDATNLRSQL